MNRREIAVAGAAAAFVAPWAAAKAASGTQQGVQMVPDPMSSSPFAEPLIRIGEIAIARENDAALDAYFAPDFKIHGPGGELTYEELKAYFAALRAAFTNLQVQRAAIIGDGSYLAARTIFSGTFTNVLTQSPVGPLQPNGKPVEWEVMNLFRYNEQGRLAEEWVRYDVRDLLQKLGAE
jgi:predicted ester cyclase